MLISYIFSVIPTVEEMQTIKNNQMKIFVMGLEFVFWLRMLKT
jgi:hypothetical protein